MTRSRRPRRSNPVTVALHQRGLTVTAVAHHLGLSQPALDQQIHGMRPTPPEVWDYLADLVGERVMAQAYMYRPRADGRYRRHPLTAALRRRGLTARAVADHTGLDHRAIPRYLRGERATPPVLWDYLADLFGTSTLELSPMWPWKPLELPPLQAVSTATAQDAARQLRLLADSGLVMLEATHHALHDAADRVERSGRDDAGTTADDGGRRWTT